VRKRRIISDSVTFSFVAAAKTESGSASAPQRQQSVLLHSEFTLIDSNFHVSTVIVVFVFIGKFLSAAAVISGKIVSAFELVRGGSCRRRFWQRPEFGIFNFSQIHRKFFPK
jgi:hypothetical protein